MPEVLRHAEFSLDMIEQPQVQNFTCGKAPWQSIVSDWLKGQPPSDSVIESITKRGTRVWIYFDLNNELVGFGSLGKSVWKYPGPRDKLRLICIPMLGVHEFHQRKGYGRQILRDLRSKADRIKIDESVIGLFVDAQNTAAAKMYTDEGFVKIDRRDDMDRMILAL